MGLQCLRSRHRPPAEPDSTRAPRVRYARCQVARERDVSVLPSGSTAAGRIDADEHQETLDRLEHRLSQAVRVVVRKVAIAAAYSGAGAGLGIGGLLTMQDEAPEASAATPGTGPHPAATSLAPMPAELLVPPADKFLLEACEAAGDDARRCIRDSRQCVDAFSRSAEACDSTPRRRSAEDY
jgi:hypothetical protein